MDNLKIKVRSLLPHLLSVAIITIVCSIYLFPQLQGLKLAAGDSISVEAWSHERLEHIKETGKDVFWNNAIFSGMPEGLLGIGRKKNLTSFLDKVVSLYTKYPLSMLIKCAVCAYLALVLIGTNVWISLFISIVLTLNVNFTVLMETGHVSKLWVICYFPFIISGFVLCMRSKYFLGAGLIALGTSLAIRFNHLQMVYYLLLALILMGLIYLIHFIRQKDLIGLAKAAGIALLAAGIGAASNISMLIGSENFAKDTMRGEPILEKTDDQPNTSSEVKGLEWNYAMSWSNNFQDVLSLAVATAAGGASSEEVSAESSAGQLMRANGMQAGIDSKVNAPMYWGGLPFTSGPYYMGAIVLLLLIYCFFEIRSIEKWVFGMAILFIVFLSMGSNLSIVNRTLFDYFPLFNKFRAPNSVVNLIPPLAIFPLAFGLNRLFDQTNKGALKKLYWSAGILGGFYISMYVFSNSTFSFSNAADANYAADILSIFQETRKQILQNDLLRCLAFTLVGAGVMWLFIKQKLKSPVLFFALVSLAAIIDIWGVNRRYLDQENFETKRAFQANFSPRPVDDQIEQLETSRGDYRVFDLSINTFNSASTSYHHNTIGGYHPAKLQRYDDLIKRHISRGNQSVLNMLNTKYIISREGTLQQNAEALGNAWFVKSIRPVETPNEEIDALGNFDPANEAIFLSNEFPEQAEQLEVGNGEGSIRLTSYAPGNMVYESNTEVNQLAVFSEIWWGPNKGWKIDIDGEPTDMIRVNYALRAMQVPAGNHTITFKLEPRAKGGIISILSSLLILIYFGYLIYVSRSNLFAHNDQIWSLPIKKKPVKKTKKRIKKKSKPKK